jgi:hypothetical protein
MDPNGGDMDTQHSAAWQTGYEAGRDQMSPKCPYPVIAPDYLEWLHGYVFWLRFSQSPGGSKGYLVGWLSSVGQIPPV